LIDGVPSSGAIAQSGVLWGFLLSLSGVGIADEHGALLSLTKERTRSRQNGVFGLGKVKQQPGKQNALVGLRLRWTDGHGRAAEAVAGGNAARTYRKRFAPGPGAEPRPIFLLALRIARRSYTLAFASMSPSFFVCATSAGIRAFATRPGRRVVLFVKHLGRKHQFGRLMIVSGDRRI